MSPSQPSVRTQSITARTNGLLWEISEDLEEEVKKYLRGGVANLEVLQDKKFRGQLSDREKKYGKAAKDAAKREKWLMPSEGGYLKVEGIEKTWKVK